jgi:predicted dehydrogenase
MTTTTPVRLGFIGCGSVMRSPYMTLVEKLCAQGAVEMTWACDIDESKRQFVRESFGIEQFSTDYRDVITAPDVDLVLVLTSMREHGPITLAALAAGKHVMVEKPMAVDLPTAKQIIELSKRSPGYLLCAPHVILSPTYQAMWQRIQRGDIGQVYTARACYGWAGPWWGQWFYRPGGGVLFDLGVYNLTSLTGLLGPAQRVMAMAGTAIPERVVDGEKMRVEVEDNVHLLLDFGNSVYAVVTSGFTIQQRRAPAIEVYGSEGAIQMMGDDWAPAGYEMWQNDVGAWQIFADSDPQWSWTEGLKHLVECIRQGTRPILNPEHAYHVLEIMLKAQESGRDGQSKVLESTFPPLALTGGLDGQPRHLVHDRSHKRQDE